MPRSAPVAPAAGSDLTPDSGASWMPASRRHVGRGPGGHAAAEGRPARSPGRSRGRPGGRGDTDDWMTEWTSAIAGDETETTT